MNIADLTPSVVDAAIATARSAAGAIAASPLEPSAMLSACPDFAILT